MNRLRTLTPEQFGALFRTILQIAGAVLATSGVFTDAQWQTISGSVFTLAVTAWGMWARSDANLIKSAADSPAVEKIVAPGTKLAASLDEPKVKSE
jgi:hypothetical protein